MHLSSYPYSMLLLQTTITAPLAEVQSWGPGVVAIASLALTVYLNMRKESREDGLTVVQRLRKVETVQNNHDLRQQGLQVEIENVADYGKRERSTMMEQIVRDHTVLRDMIKDVPAMRDLINRMAERLESVKETNIKIDNKMDRILDVLTHK